MEAGNEAGAKVTLFEGVQMSTDKVINFTTKTDRYDWLFGTADGGPAINLESDFIDLFNLDLAAEWDAGSTTDKWNILAMQYFIACYGNGIDPYNFYRRTGYPTTLQPNIEPVPGGVVRSFYYPANAAANNSNITQKSNVLGQVFWDTNPASPAFPIAN